MNTPAPAPRRLLVGVLVAIAVAIVLLFTVILPAERGFDPLGTGRLLGLTAMGSPGGATGAATAAGDGQTVVLQEVVGGNAALASTVVVGDGRDPVPLPNPAVHQKQDAAPRTETLKIRLGLDEKTEVKAKMAAGKMLTYSWSVEGGQVYVDYHGHDPKLGEKFWVRYEEVDGTKAGHGSLVAPFSGEHGWFWLNTSDGPITITLTVTGYQDSLVNYGIIP
ncbi:MAG: hypothetical protein RL026_2495 [Pseudomonadota bacterium]|jgi:hypothetical protein